MKAWRIAIENNLEALGRRICLHPYLTAFFFLTLAGLLMAQLPKTTVDTSPTGMLHPHSKAMVDYNAFRDQFGRDELILVAIGPVDVFSQDTLSRIRDLHTDLEENLPYLEDVTSIINARSTRGEDDTLIVEDLLEEWPRTQEELETIRQRALANPLYKNTLLSQDGRYTAIAIKTSAYLFEEGSDSFDAFSMDDADAAPAAEPAFITDKENREIIKAVRQVMAHYDSPDFPMCVAGSPVMTDDLRTYMFKDMKLFSVLAVILIATLLFVVFRTWAGVVWPLLTVVFSLLCTLGLMAWTGTPLKMPTQILPSFILAVGVGDSVHILAIFYRAMRQGMEKHEAIAHALGHSGLAVILTSLTTAGGLLSFARTDIAPIADLGIFCAVGVFFALCFTLFWLPAMLAIFPPGVREAKQSSQVRMDRFLHWVGDFAMAHPKGILAATGGILLLSAVGISMLHFSHHALSWFPDKADIRVSTQKIDDSMRGTLSMEVVVDTGEENGFYDPKRLAALSRLAEEIEPYSSEKVFVGQTQSVADILKEINQALHENRPEHYTVPTDPALIAQEFLLFENSGSDDLEDVVDTDFSKARFTIKLPSVDAVYYHDFVREVTTRFEESFPGDRITITGLLTLLYSTFYAVMHTMAESYIIAMIVITVLMVFMIGSLRMGMISMIPNLAPIVVCLGVMGALDLTLNAFTILIGSVALGLAVDDTIHFMHNFKRYYGQYGDVKEAVQETLQTTGRAMLFTTIALSTGFIVFLFASMKNLVTYGALGVLAIVLALTADFLVVPALLSIIYKDSNHNSHDSDERAHAA